MEPTAIYAVQAAKVRCKECDREWILELTPLWMEFESWPMCCGLPADLLYPLVALAG